jgi:serine/threonine-protein kinase RsbW
MHVYQLNHTTTLQALPVLREFIAESCARHQVHEDVVWALQLSVDEAATNVIEHGFKGRADGKIEVVLTIESAQVKLELLDNGPAFNPIGRPEPDTGATADAREPGGLGLFFIQNVMDEVYYRSTPAGNVLELRKSLSSE